MRYKIRTYSKAVEDFEKIKKYLSLYSQQTVKKFFDEYRQKLEQLKDFPYAYAKSEVNPNHRRMVIGDYIVFYQVDDDAWTITITRAAHGSRDFRRFMRSDAAGAVARE